MFFSPSSQCIISRQLFGPWQGQTSKPSPRKRRAFLIEVNCLDCVSSKCGVIHIRDQVAHHFWGTRKTTEGKKSEKRIRSSFKWWWGEVLVHVYAEKKRVKFGGQANTVAEVSTRVAPSIHPHARSSEATSLDGFSAWINQSQLLSVLAWRR